MIIKKIHYLYNLVSEDVSIFSILYIFYSYIYTYIFAIIQQRIYVCVYVVHA